MRKAKRFDVKFIAVNFTNQIVKSPYFTRINEKSEIIPLAHGIIIATICKN